MIIFKRIFHQPYTDSHVLSYYRNSSEALWSRGHSVLLIKSTCSVTFSLQPCGSLPESVAHCTFPPRRRQCANNYREPEAYVCIWQRGCAEGGMCNWPTCYHWRLSRGKDCCFCTLYKLRQSSGNTEAKISIN